MSRKHWFCLASVASLVLVFLLLFPCIQTVRNGERWSYSMNNMGQIGLALHSYHDAFGKLPPAVVHDKEGRPLYSWRVLILPFIEEGSLYSKFHLDEPWDSPHNQTLSKKTPRYYRPPFGELDPGLTYYKVLIGPGTAFERPGLTWNDFPDGPENTILAVEGGEPVIWSQPVDLSYDPAAPLPKLGVGYKKPVRFLCRYLYSWEGFTACFADGKKRFIPTSTDEHLIRALVTRNGGEKVKASSLD